MSPNGLIEFFCHVYVQSTPKQQIQKDFYAWSIVHTSTQNKQLGRVQSRVQDTTAVKGRGKASQKLYYGVIGTHIVFFWVSVKRMVCLSLILSVLCLGDNISEDLPASSAQKWMVIKIIRSLWERDFVFLSCDNGHLTIWNVNKSFHVRGSSWAPGAAMAVRLHRSDSTGWGYTPGPPKVYLYKTFVFVRSFLAVKGQTENLVLWTSGWKWSLNSHTFKLKKRRQGKPGVKVWNGFLNCLHWTLQMLALLLRFSGF